jgi:hypothetical protein
VPDLRYGVLVRHMIRVISIALCVLLLVSCSERTKPALKPDLPLADEVAYIEIRTDGRSNRRIEDPAVIAAALKFLNDQTNWTSLSEGPATPDTLIGAFARKSGHNHWAFFVGPNYIAVAGTSAAAEVHVSAVTTGEFRNMLGAAR